MYGPPLYPRFHNYGVAHTRIGVAVVACGGEATGDCASETAIIFASCSPEWSAYFNRSDATDDRLVRALIGQGPPVGNRWLVECGAAPEMFEHQPGFSR